MKHTTFRLRHFRHEVGSETRIKERGLVPVPITGPPKNVVETTMVDSQHLLTTNLKSFQFTSYPSGQFMPWIEATSEHGARVVLLSLVSTGLVPCQDRDSKKFSLTLQTIHSSGSDTEL